MKTVVEFLAENPGHYFATVGTDGKPKVRSFQFMLEKDGKLFFCTSNQKPVFTEMMKHPFVEICASGADNSWMRLSGKAVFKGYRHQSEDSGTESLGENDLPDAGQSDPRSLLPG